MDIFYSDVTDIGEVHVLGFTIIRVKFVGLVAPLVRGGSDYELMLPSLEHHEVNEECLVEIRSCIRSIDQMRLLVQQTILENLFPLRNHVMFEEFLDCTAVG